MGLDTIPTRGNTTMLAEWFNVLKSVLANDLVPRDVNGIPADEGGSLGTPDYPWLNVRAKNLFLEDELVVPGKITARSHRIVSGKANTDNFPNFLTPAGAGSGLSAVLSATATNFEAFINGTEVSVASDMTYSSLTAAPGSNNTALINDIALDDYADSMYLGEFDSRVITIDAVGSEITALNGKVAAFKVGTEVFLAKVDTTNARLVPIFRGWAGTSRVTLDDNDTITLLKLNTLLLKDDGATKISSIYFPESVSTVPASATAGKVYIERSTGKHYYDDGSTVSAAYMVIGCAVCTSADCVYAQHEDFDLFWSDDLTADYRIDDTTSVIVSRGFLASVAGNEVFLPDDQHVTQASHMDTGESVAVNTLFFLYCTPTGDIVFSSIAPRPFDAFKRGYYHPRKYYRCIGHVQTNAASAFAFAGTSAEFLADGVWICPPLVDEAIVEGCGGGGGGGYGAFATGTSNATGGHGGSGAPHVAKVISTKPGQAIAAVIGAGGAGVTSVSIGTYQYGADGGSSTFGTEVFPPGKGGIMGNLFSMVDAADTKLYLMVSSLRSGSEASGGNGCGLEPSVTSRAARGSSARWYGGDAGQTNDLSALIVSGGGGGGSGPYMSGAVGGVGGFGNSNSPAATSGGNATANSGAGGGGGGASGIAGDYQGFGGNGGSGRIIVRCPVSNYGRQ